MIGIRVPLTIGIGDAVQFTSLPENYFRAKNERLVDVEQHPVFDHNPFVLRGVPVAGTIDLWQAHCYFGQSPGLWPRQSVLLSNAEAQASILRVPVVLNRPRLYQFEEFPFHERKTILLHVQGRSHGQMPKRVVEHVLEKYGRDNIRRIGLPGEWDYPFPDVERIHTNSFWELAAIVSQARMFIGVDSGPSWVAQCYPDVVVKKIRLIPEVERLKTWVPLEPCVLNSVWDDRSAAIYNVSEDDVGFTYSYKRI